MNDCQWRNHRKAPSTNIQAPSRFGSGQTSNIKESVRTSLVLGIWCFSGAWCLEFGCFISTVKQHERNLCFANRLAINRANPLGLADFAARLHQFDVDG